MKPQTLAALTVLIACNADPDDTDSQNTNTDTTTTETETTETTTWGAEALDLVTAKAGTYEGSWQMFGLDPLDVSYPSMTWTDVAVATNPRIDGERALVDVTDTMDMGNYGEMQATWLEGVMIETDGSPGDEYMEMDGVVTVFSKVADDEYEYVTDIADSDYFSWSNVSAQNLIDGYHTTHKTVSWPDGQETHDITRTTTLEYDGGDGPVVVEFTSLVGQHIKVGS